MDHYNFLMGAKVGDLFHSLVAPAYMHLLHGKKSNFYITEAFDKFETSLERTIEELEPIMAFQPYINSFEKFRNGIHKVDFDLNMFRFSGVGFNHANITFLMAMQTLESVSVPFNFQYLHAPVLEEYKDYLIISRKPSRTQWNDFVEIQYKHVMSQFDKKLFVSFNGKDYEDFPFKDQVDLLIVEELYDFIKIVNSCKLFLANCSGPLCFASALNANRIGEVGDWVAARYRDDFRFTNKSEIFDDNGKIYTPHTKYLKRDFK
jgi:hypothetical protein